MKKGPNRTKIDFEIKVLEVTHTWNEEVGQLHFFLENQNLCSLLYILV